MAGYIDDLMGSAKESSQSSPFWATRAKAIQAYASLEQAMCRLFCLLTRTEMDVAGIVFFKIASAQARISIIDKLWKLQYKNKYNLFRNSLLEAMKPIDIKRNEIVHWNVVSTSLIKDDGSYIHELNLKPPTYWTDMNDNEIGEADLKEFIVKCNFYTRVVGMYDAIMRDNTGPIPADELSAWRDIFLQRLAYPPQSGTLLAQILLELQAQLQASCQ